MNRASQFLIITAAVCWGSTGIFTRPLFASGLTSFEMTSIRSLFTSVCLLTLLSVTNRKVLTLRLKDVGLFICMGSFGNALMSILYFNTVDMITMSAASLLLYTSPYMVIIMSAAIFKEKITLQKLSALFIAFTGCVMTVGFFGGAGTPAIGIATGLGAAFCYAVYNILAKLALLRGYSPFAVSAYVYTIAGVLMIPFCDYRKVAGLIVENHVDLIYLLMLSFFISTLPSLCYFKGLEKTEPGRAMIIAFVEPMTASAAGFIAFDEMLTPVKLLGMALILLSLVILNLQAPNNRRRRRTDTPPDSA